jgi:hypothetical protein
MSKVRPKIALNFTKGLIFCVIFHKFCQKWPKRLQLSEMRPPDSSSTKFCRFQWNSSVFFTSSINRKSIINNQCFYKCHQFLKKVSSIKQIGCTKTFKVKENRNHLPKLKLNTLGSRYYPSSLILMDFLEIIETPV